VRTTDGTFITPSFGFGKDGGVVTLHDGSATSIAKLDPVRRRIGVAIAPDNAIYVAYFVVDADKKHTGGVARLDLAGGETDLDIPDLSKPVGLVATDTTLFIADQNKSTIVAYTFATKAVTTVARDLPGADLLTRLPGGDFVTGGRKGAVYRIDKAGAAKEIASGFAQVRGTAYDPAKKRLFVVEHGDAGHHKLHLLPVEP
jgi:sugar lactone lactonase YvrE